MDQGQSGITETAVLVFLDISEHLVDVEFMSSMAQRHAQPVESERSFAFQVWKEANEHQKYMLTYI